jgi:hypothetical protein
MCEGLKIGGTHEKRLGACPEAFHFAFLNGEVDAIL